MTTALEGGEGSASRPGRSLPPGKTRYPLYRRLGGPKGRSGQVRKISSPPGFDSRTVQPVASRYTHYATRPTLLIMPYSKFWRLFYHVYIPAVLWKIKFKVVYHKKYGSYQYCIRVRILGTVLIGEVLSGMRICSSNSASPFTKWVYLLHWRMSCSLFRVGIWLCSQNGCLLVFSVKEWYILLKAQTCYSF